MYVTAHAQAQLYARLDDEAVDVIDALESRYGPPGLVAIVVRRLGEARGAKGETSNGDLVIAIADDSSVVTVMFRRSSQPLTKEALGVRNIEDWSYVDRS